jgi:phosphonate C-P lyase system protein PhnG
MENRFRELLPHLDEKAIERLLGFFAPLADAKLREPQTGLVMITARDAFGEKFHLGEILVSVGEIELSGIQGHATVMGDDPRKAVLAATVNAVCRHPEAEQRLASFRAELEQIAAAVGEKLARERNLIASTRVNFDSMAPEEM